MTLTRLSVVDASSHLKATKSIEVHRFEKSNTKRDR